MSVRPATRHPRWRDWHQHPGAEVPADQDAATGHVVSCMLEEAGSDGSRWADLAGALKKLPDRERNRVLTAVEDLDPGYFSAPDRATVWRALTEVAVRHRQFPGAWWAMRPANVGRIEESARKFTPESLSDRHSGLFSGSPVLPGTRGDDHADYWETLRSARHQAVRAVIDGSGVSGLLALARRAEIPAGAGQAAAEITGDLLAPDLLPLLGADGPNGQVARGYAGARIDAEGSVWARDQLRRYQEWTARQQAMLLLSAPRPGKQLLELLRELDPEAQALYWQQVNPAGICEAEARRTAAGELNRHGRPGTAAQVLAGSASSAAGLPEAGDVTLVETVLLHVAAGPRADGENPAEHYADIRDLLDYLERSQSDTTTRAHLEFLFAIMLNQFRPARALAAVLQADPQAFADMVSAAYLPDGQTRADTVITPQRRDLATIALTALRSWHTPPGVQADSSVDPKHLQPWVAETRRLLAGSGHAKVGDHAIGRILAHAQADTEGIWPPEAVRNLIEELESPDMETGLLDGKTSTDLTIRSPFPSGDNERAAAAQFRRWAAQTTAQWRTASLLRTLAEDSEERARNQERFTQEIENLGP